VFSAAEARNLDISSFHFQHEDTLVQKFNYGDKQDVNRRWKSIKGQPEVTTVVEQAPTPRRIVVRRRGIRCCR